MGFEIIQHPGDAILAVLPVMEIVYPESPTDADIAEYDRRAREVVDAQRKRPFLVLADQRALHVMSPALVAMLAELNTYAAARGMVRTARVVSGTMGGLQGHRLARAGRFDVGVFDSRELALVWLHEPK